MNLVVRAGDRVLLQRPANFDEPVVMGVLDGFARRPATPLAPGPVVTFEADQVLQLATANGAPLLEVHQGQSGPIVRFINDDVHLEVPGRLDIDAQGIRLTSHCAGIEIDAEDDLHLNGEVIHLNGPQRP
jgi:hypothetical protein